MEKTTAILVRRFLLSLKPRQIFFRSELRKFGNANTIDQCIYRLIDSERIVRLIEGVYLRHQADGWLPSAEEVGRAKAKELGRILTEEPKIIASKIGLSSLEVTEIVFYTTGRTLNFRYQGKIIRFQEKSARKIKMNDSRLGKAINILWYLGPEFPLEDSRWFLRKYLHREERQQLRQDLPGVPEWLLTRLKELLPEYLPLGFRAYDADAYETEDSQYDIKGDGYPFIKTFDFN
ncbi:MAG: hypothetical protein IPG59_21500 [Candidatus Melainabacteria bacterium]|nr:MAG: hypothetical protein IPG59_21500 [Candidatus Melainabacteria bacterium]